MDLIAEAKQKNEQLLVKNLMFQQCLCARVNAPEFKSFLITFIAAPVIVGAAAQLAFGSKGLMPHHLYRSVLPGLRLLPLF